MKTIQGWVARETEKAYLVDDGCSKTRKVWWPKSQIKNLKREGEKIEFEAPEWLFMKKLAEACGLAA